MRIICDVCESAPAILFCAADEAALCRACDDKVHMCNKLANRHVRVGLVKPIDVPQCDICENSPAFFYCEVDGSSLCLQCDMGVHVGGKRSHGRYLLLRQKVEFPGDTSEPTDRVHGQSVGDQLQNHNSNANNADTTGGGTQLFDLNMQPQRVHGQSSSNYQEL